MKKLLAILLALLLTASLFACSSEPASTNTSADSSPASANSPASSPDSSPSSSPANSPASSPASSPAGTQASAPPVANDPYVSEAPIRENLGWYTDQVDWFARDPYKIAFLYDRASATADLLDGALQKWSERVNFSYTSYNADSNADAFINTMGVLSQQGYTGMVLNPDASYADRVKQAAQEYGIAWLPGFVPLLDMNGDPIWPQESLGVKYQADLMTDWLRESYKDYLGDIDRSKIGLISTSQYVVPVLKLVSDFSIVNFQTDFPEAADNAYEVDTVNFGFDANGGFNAVAPFLAAHPEIEHWFVIGSIEDVVQGACRAIDAAGLTDKTISISCGANLLMDSWLSGTDTGCYKAGIYYSMQIYAEPLVCGIIAMLDGRATPETLWPEWKDPNQQYPVVTVQSTILTVDNYDTYDDYVQAYLTAIENGTELPKAP